MRPALNLKGFTLHQLRVIKSLSIKGIMEVGFPFCLSESQCRLSRFKHLSILRLQWRILLPSQKFIDEALSTYKVKHPSENNHDSCVKRYQEKHKCLHIALTLAIFGIELNMVKEHHQSAKRQRMLEAIKLEFEGFLRLHSLFQKSVKSLYIFR